MFHDILDKVGPDDVDFFSFSLDGATPETNDALRGPGCFETCTASIRKAVKRGFSTSLIYTVSSANIHELKRMPPLLKDLGVERFFIQVIGIRGKSAKADSGARQVSREAWLGSCLPETAQAAAEAGIRVNYPEVFLNPDEKPFDCAGLCADNYFIFPNGRVYRCPLCEDFPIHGLAFAEERLIETAPLNETDFFRLEIPEGCVMNKLIQPGNLGYLPDGTPEYRIACCMLKAEVPPESPPENRASD
jgi:Fe-coproporphyrin III synthase